MAEPTEPKTPEPKAKPAPKKIRTVYGQMVDMTNGEVYETTFVDYDRPTGWTASQLEAKKMILE